jgi:hypothetical protein
MRFNEFLHMHEGWYNRRYGIIEIPNFEPCMCKYCLNRAKRNYTDDDEEKENNKSKYDNVMERLVNERYSPKNARQRSIPVSWSPRIMAALEAYFEEVGAYPKSAKTAKRVLNEYILKNANYFSPDQLDFHGLRATGETYWAFENINSKARADMGGHRIAELPTYSGTSPIELVSQTREAVGMDPVDFDYYDIAKDSRPHPQEPFPDPREINPLKKQKPYEAPPIFNPRSEKRQADIDMTENEFIKRSDTIEVVKSKPHRPTADELHSKVRRLEAVLEGDEDSADPLGDAHDSKKDADQGPGQTIVDEF